MGRLRGHPLVATTTAFALAAVAVIAIASATGWPEFGHAWSRLDPAWIAVAGCGQAAAFIGYGLAYRSVARVHGGPRLKPPLVARLVAAGFGASAIAGGFAIDQRALYAIDDDTHEATVRVLGLGALEWALLAPAAWVSALVLLVSGQTKAMPSLLWPWAVAVPVGFGFGLWLSHPARGLRDSHRRAVRVVMRGVGVLHTLAREPRRYAGAWLGVSAYWALDILSFYGALRFVGLAPNAGEVVVAFATGYALTRRSLPLGGAGVTEALMTYALHWVGEPVAPALAAVVVYRAFNFVLPTVPALWVRPRVMPLIAAAEEGRTPAWPERRFARGELDERALRGAGNP
jgi:uncharacterized membrane protein YbhN (UPF0104 family)